MSAKTKQVQEKRYPLQNVLLSLKGPLLSIVNV